MLVTPQDRGPVCSSGSNPCRCLEFLGTMNLSLPHPGAHSGQMFCQFCHEFSPPLWEVDDVGSIYT